MNTLIKIQEQNGSNVVSARELHKFLESNSKFSDWINSKMKKYDFIKDVDYTTYSEMSEKVFGRPLKNYALTMDMAKELAMLEANAKGQQARRYFIQCEKQYKNLRLDIQKSDLETVNLKAYAFDLIQERTEINRKLRNARKEIKKKTEQKQKLLQLKIPFDYKEMEQILN